MADHADDIIEGRVHSDGSWAFNGNGQGYPTGHAGHVAKNRFLKTDNKALFGVYNFMSRRSKIRDTAQANELMSEFTQNWENDPMQNAVIIQEDFGKFVKFINDHDSLNHKR